MVQKNGEASAEDWQKLFATVPYLNLKAREEAMGSPFTDEDFKKFLVSPEARAKSAEWDATLARIKRADMRAIGESVLAWLPAGAEIHASVFPEIKPRQNSFVWGKPGDAPAIFLYLGDQTKAQFENTVAHECHHIGLGSLQKQQESIAARLPENVRRAVHWMGAFGEGEAMLAAAGSVDVHPHFEDDAAVRARWDSDMMHFNADLAALEEFFTEILDGRLADDAAIMKRARPFWGDAQGAWYTVGYEMAALVEKRFGRQALLGCLMEPQKLLAIYNQVAIEARAKGADLGMWSEGFLKRLAGVSPR